MATNPSDSVPRRGPSNFSTIAAVIGLLGVGFVAGTFYQANHVGPSLANRLLDGSEPIAREAPIEASEEPVYQSGALARAQYLVDTIRSDSPDSEVDAVVSNMFEEYLCERNGGANRGIVERQETSPLVLRAALGSEGMAALARGYDNLLGDVLSSMDRLGYVQNNFSGVQLGLRTDCSEVTLE